MNSFVRAQVAAGFATLLAIGSMLAYPGGTLLDHSTRHYAFDLNFLSDLGMTVAYNGHPNRLGAALFVASLLTLLVGIGPVALAFMQQFRNAESKRFARMGVFTTLLVVLSFGGVAFTPENSAMDAHVAFTRIAFGIFPLVALMFAFASRREPTVPNGMTAVWTALTIALAIYAEFMNLRLSTDTIGGLRAGVLAQKSISVIAVGLLTLQCRLARRAAARHHPV